MNQPKTSYFFYAPIVGDNKHAAETADATNDAIAEAAHGPKTLEEMHEYLDRMKMAFRFNPEHIDGIRINSRTC